MKAIRKEFYIEIVKTKSRFISIFLIVALGVAFFTGILSTEPDMRLSADKFYDDGNLMDIRVVSTTGITDDIINEINDIEGVELVKGTYWSDYINVIDGKEGVVSLQSYTQGINDPILSSGRLPQSNKECIVESLYAEEKEIKIGDIISLSSGNEVPIEGTINSNNFEVTGIYTTPYYIGIDRGNTTIGNGKVNGVIMVDSDAFNIPAYTSCYVLVEGARDYVAYSDKYNDLVDEIKVKIEKYTKEKAEELYKTNAFMPQFYVLDRNSIQTYGEFDQDAERIGNIGKVVPLVFFIVAALVSLTTMTRMVEEQRTQIGTLKALGYKKREVADKYIKYGLLATISGSIIGGVLGSVILPRVIIDAYKMLYTLDEILTPINAPYFLLSCVLAITLVTLATYLSCYKELMESPAMLMRPAPPKKTKKLLLERIPFIWKRLNFSRKSTIRNILRYKKRVFMTLFGISGCMALLVVGFGIKDSINSVIGIQYDELHIYDMVLGLENGVTNEELNNIKDNLETNENIENYLIIKNSSLTLEKDDSSYSGNIYLTDEPDRFTDFIKLRDRKKHKEYSMDNDTIMISEKTAGKLDVGEGDTITLAISESEKYQFEIGHVVENYVFHNVYLTKDLYEKVIGKAEYNQIIIQLTEEGKAKEENVVEELLKIDGISGASYIDKMRNKFDDMLGSLDVITVVIVIAAGGLAFIVLYNLNNINISERKRELATLKVLGFYDIEVSKYIYRENIIITIIGIALGTLFGIILHKFVITTAEVDVVMFGRSVDFLSFVWSGLLTILFAVIVNVSMHFKLKKVDMATSLKSVE